MNDKKYTTVREAIHNREVGLAEVRVMLTQAIEKLKASKNFPSVQFKQLKDFWHKDHPAAPFEELFTLKQIAEINIDTFFKKRSLGPGKIMAIVASIENAIGKPPKRGRIQNQKKTAKVSKVKRTDKIELLKLKYNMLISKCRMMNEVLDLSETIPQITKSKVLDSIASEIKKIDAQLISHHAKISKLILTEN